MLLRGHALHQIGEVCFTVFIDRIEHLFGRGSSDGGDVIDGGIERDNLAPSAEVACHPRISTDVVAVDING